MLNWLGKRVASVKCKKLARYAFVIAYGVYFFDILDDKGAFLEILQRKWKKDLHVPPLFLIEGIKGKKLQ